MSIRFRSVRLRENQWPNLPFLIVVPVALLVLSRAHAQPVIGLYPTYPAAPPLAGKSPGEQAAQLRSMGATLAGGRFKDGAIPKALRQAGIKTFGLVVLFQGEEHWQSHPESRPIMADGQPLFKDRWYAGVCPNQPWLRREKLSEIEGMLESGRYDVINLDFIRYPGTGRFPSRRSPTPAIARFVSGSFRETPASRFPL